MSTDFLRAYDESYERVFSYLVYRAASRSAAEDLTQTTFERAFRAWDRFDPRRSQPTTWLIAIARNVYLDQLRADRRTARTQAAAIATAEAEPGPERRHEGDQELAEALATLGERERSILALRFGAELQSGQIAEILGLSVANVHQITSRSLKRLRDLLQDRPDTDQLPFERPVPGADPKSSR